MITEQHGFTYISKVIEINKIYDKYAHSGLSNREILRRYIWPIYHISERTFYYYLKAPSDPRFIQKCKEANLL